MLGLAWHESEKMELFEGRGGKIEFIDQTK